MAPPENIQQPSPGSDDICKETNDSNVTGVPGTDTRPDPAANSGNKHTKNVNDDEEVVTNLNGEKEFLESDEH